MGSKDLYLKIRELCAAAGLTQAELARRVGMEASHLNIYFQGRGDLQAHRFVSLLLELGIDIEGTVKKATEKKKRRKLRRPGRRDIQDFVAPLSRLAQSEAEAIYLIARGIAADRKRAGLRIRRA